MKPRDARVPDGSPPASATGTPPSLAGALLAARETVMAPLRPRLRAIGLTEAQWRVLRALSSQGDRINGRNLAKAALLHPPSVARILQELTDRALVERRVPANDRRSHSIALTPAGHALIEEALANNRWILQHYRAVFGAERLDALMAELAAFTEAIAANPPPVDRAD
jgi:homoprotocatechuate degradation regulator HpaR